MKKLFAMLMVFGLLAAPQVFATPASDTLLAKYRSGGAGQPDAAKGEKDWSRVEVVDGEKMSCTTCHGNDFRKPGKHHVTGKTIDPMSVRVNPERYTNVKKVEKWFKRNCLDTFGRECTAQEKADFLTFMLTQ